MGVAYMWGGVAWGWAHVYRSGTADRLRTSTVLGCGGGGHSGGCIAQNPDIDRIPEVWLAKYFLFRYVRKYFLSI